MATLEEELFTSEAMEWLKRYCGYTQTVGEFDHSYHLIPRLRQQTIQEIKHFCNISEIPECLDSVVMDIVCGKFLRLKKESGTLTKIEFEPIVKRIQDGDTTVEYSASGNADDDFNAFVDRLINGHQADLLAHRKLRW